MDDFEVYIKSNKEAFNEPTLNKALLWEKIEQELAATAKPKIYFLNPLFKMAAVFTLFVGFAVLAFLMVGNQSANNKYTNEVIEIKSHYNQLISIKMTQIENTQPLTTSEKNNYLQIIDDLDKEASELQYELQQNINNMVVVDAIVKNYKQRLQLLELLQHRFQKNKIKNNEQVILI